MEKKPYPHFLNNLKYRPLLVGFVATCIHFVITYFLKASFAIFGYIISLTLTAPSYVLSSIINYFLWTYISDKVIIVAWEAYNIPFILVSSLFYGIVVGFLASKKISLRFVGIALIFICLLGVIGLCLIALSAQANA